jgi:serine/threonine protein kinase
MNQVILAMGISNKKKLSRRGCMHIYINWIKSKDIGIKDFEFLKLLGVGAFGAVWLVKKKHINDKYAMKIIDTKRKQDKNFLKSLKNEKDIYSVLEGDFVVKAYYSFSY